MNGIIAKVGTRNGEMVVTIAKGYARAVKTLPIFWKDYRPWMNDVVGAVRQGKPVAADDIAYMVATAKRDMLSARQKALKTEVLAVANLYAVA